MPGYANRVITLTFNELAEPGDDIHVIIRNPRLLPSAELQALAGGTDPKRIAEAKKAIEETGDAGNLLTDDDANRGFEFVAKMVVGWRVYDATSTEKDQPLLPLPATAESVAKLPQDILLAIMDEVGKANPRALPADGTGRTS